MADDETYMIRTDKVADSRSLMGHLVMHVVGCLNRETMDRLLAQAKARGGMMDIRLVIEGEPFAFAQADRLLSDGFERAKQAAVRQHLDAKIGEIEERIREAMEPIIADFGKPPDDDE